MKTAKKLGNYSCFDHFCFDILIAIELLMSFTFLGYIHLSPISITIAYLPILVAGCLFGPLQSVIMGAIFGVTSMYKASASYVMASDAVFSPFLSGFPVNSLLLSIGTRILFGFLVGMAFVFVKNKKYYRLWIGVISAVAPKIHSLIVYTTMGILFPELDYNYTSAFHLTFNNVIFMIICVVIVELSWIIYYSDTIQRIKFGINYNNPYASKKMNLFFIIFEFFIVCMAVFSTIYFYYRQSYMLEWNHIIISKKVAVDLLLLQIQFLISLLALNTISIIFLVFIYKYMSYREYKGEIDELTEIMGRRMFLYHCENVINGWFLFVDADYFKSINDTFGHAVGDKVLREIAMHLQNIFGEDGKVGRLGGDEFAVIIEKSITQQELEQRLEHFLSMISGILSEKKVSCSIGAYEFTVKQKVKDLLAETDKVLYEAKKKGRACYVIKTYEEQNKEKETIL